jgi:biopolymer transport protein ExbD
MEYFKSRKARIEIIPMIDIMLFLLVFFFMISLRMIPAKGVVTQLPRSSTAQQMQHPKVMVSMREDGSIDVDGNQMSLAELTQMLARQPEPDKTQVTIAGAKSASVQHLLDVMDACRHGGVIQIGLAARDTN